VDERLETGIVLTGTEVKSIRAGQAQISDAFVRIDRGRPVMYHAHIAEYSHGNMANHNPYRPRPLLMHEKEIARLAQEVQAGGRTLIPLRMYFKQGLIKVEVGLCRGKKKFDKRQTMKEKDEMREAQRTVRHHL